MDKPVLIRMEIEGMRHTLMHAMSEYAANMDADIQAAIDREITPEAVTAIIHENTRRILEDKVKQELESFFAFGPGAAVIKEAVQKMMGRRAAAPAHQRAKDA